MSFEIIDFHTHPFLRDCERLGAYTDVLNMKTKDFFEDMEKAKVSVCAGSVVASGVKAFSDIHTLNVHALSIKEHYKGKYVPGFHIHPNYVEESIAEIEFAEKNGVRLIGELVGYHHGWSGYASSGFVRLAEILNEKKMIICLHIESPKELDEAEKVISANKDVIFVLAHPGYGERLTRHLEINKKYENSYMDLSGGGIELYGCLQKIVNTVGYERLLYGSDFPVFSMQKHIAAVLSEKISDTAKEYVFSKNAKRLLNI